MKNIRMGDSMKCQFCGTENGADAVFCHGCGTRLESLTEAAVGGQEDEFAFDALAAEDEIAAAAEAAEDEFAFDAAQDDENTAFDGTEEGEQSLESVAFTETEEGGEDDFPDFSSIDEMIYEENEIYEDEQKDYVNRSVIAAIVFNMVFGLIALFYALGARDDFEDGENESGAMRAKTAKRLCTLCFVLGTVKWLIIAALFVMFVAKSSAVPYMTGLYGGI